MKIGTLFFAVLILAGTLTSCRKCITCEANDYANGIYYSKDYCGTSKQIKDSENTWYTDYPSYLGWSSTCYNK